MRESRRPRFTLEAAAIVMIAAASFSFAQPASELRMNQIQVIGTHNSYHLRKEGGARSKEWDYAHRPIDEQLASGVRSLEIDLYYKPGAGWRVMHVPRLDDHSSCPLLADCIETVKRWSEANPRHVPISFLCEVKEEGLPLDKSLVEFDAAAADALDAEIRAGFGQRLIAPDDVRGDAPTLAEAVTKRGWPTLEASRGKVFFILHEEGAYRDVYVKDRPSLEGRAMFIRSEPGRPDCATLVEDTPEVERIQKLVKEGYWVRTRADGRLRPGLAPPGMNRVQAALASGAQIVSTDYPPGGPFDAAGGIVRLPGGASARCNPANADCDSAGASIE